MCIEKEAAWKSPLRRFSEHWIAWNFHLAAGSPSEFANLEAAQRANEVTQTTRDPRIYDLEHWYSGCGDKLNPSCSHDPDIRAAALRAAKRVKTRLPEIGRDWETQKLGTQTIAARPHHRRLHLAQLVVASFYQRHPAQVPRLQYLFILTLQSGRLPMLHCLMAPTLFLQVGQSFWE